jgi:hypothetical protein
LYLSEIIGSATWNVIKLQRPDDERLNRKERKGRKERISINSIRYG